MAANKVRVGRWRTGDALTAPRAYDERPNHDPRRLLGRQEMNMQNEGMIVNTGEVLIKSEMVRQLAKLKAATPDELERQVFRALTGRSRDEVDWELEDNQAGEFLWIKVFDQLLVDLAEDGYLRTEQRDGKPVLVANEQDAPTEYSQLLHPSRSQ